MDNRRTFLKSLAGLAAARAFRERRGDEPDAARARGTGIRSRHSFRCCRASRARRGLRSPATPGSRNRDAHRRQGRRSGEIRDASKKTGLKIHSVMNVEHQCRAALER